MPITNQEFRNALATFASGVTVVTAAAADGKLYGLTVSAFCSVSLDPPLVLICIEKTARCHEAFKESGKIVVNVLAEDQRHVSERFATQMDDKFEGIEYSLNDAGTPVLEGAATVLECAVRESLDGGDHTIFILEVEDTEVGISRPLLYYGGNYRTLGA
ncbi:MAG: flavin reductase family protein [Acidobacteriota bacterium]|nr:MAG: flavin reductase family protein [Acidobacteriota bacterium]